MDRVGRSFSAAREGTSGGERRRKTPSGHAVLCLGRSRDRWARPILLCAVYHARAKSRSDSPKGNEPTTHSRVLGHFGLDATSHRYATGFSAICDCVVSRVCDWSSSRITNAIDIAFSTALDLEHATWSQHAGQPREEGFHLHDPKTNKAMSIVVYEDPAAAQTAGKALGERADEQKVGINPDHIEFFHSEAF
jgi:hypothetical protein